MLKPAGGGGQLVHDENSLTGSPAINQPVDVDSSITRDVGVINLSLEFDCRHAKRVVGGQLELDGEDAPLVRRTHRGEHSTLPLKDVVLVLWLGCRTTR